MKKVLCVTLLMYLINIFFMALDVKNLPVSFMAYADYVAYVGCFFVIMGWLFSIILLFVSTIKTGNGKNVKIRNVSAVVAICWFLFQFVILNISAFQR